MTRQRWALTALLLPSNCPHHQPAGQQTSGAAEVYSRNLLMG